MGVGVAEGGLAVLVGVEVAGAEVLVTVGGGRVGVGVEVGIVPEVISW